ncbi:MAG: hypothetical protein ACREJL_06890 [Candidatus Methylomirabilales bacterium]
MPDAIRREVSRLGEYLLSHRFQPRVRDEAVARRHGFNYAVAVFSEWRGQNFSFCVRYRTPSGRPEEEFVVRTTRMQYTGSGRFTLAYFRHTNRWQPVYFGLTVTGCFQAIEDEEIFWPLT